MRSTLLFILFGALILIGIVSTFGIMARASKGYDKAKQRRIDRGPQIPCPICGSSMQLVGVQEFKLSESAEGLDRPVATALGAVGGSLPLEVHRCPTCRNVQFILPPSAG
ncbi:MAG: hypothetical protein ACT4OM_00540 [Actinomycetota bacterium]